MTNFYLFVLQISILVFVLSILLAQKLFNNLHSLNYLILVFFFTLLRSIADFITAEQTNPFDITKEYHFIFMIIANLFVYRYFEYVYSTSINWYRFGIILIPSLTLFGIYIYALIYGSSSANPDFWIDLMGPHVLTEPYFTFFVDLQTIMVWMFGVYVSYLLIRQGSGPVIESFLLFLTTCLALIASLLESSEHFSGTYFEGNLLFIFPFVIVMGLFVYNPYFSYCSPHPIKEMKLIEIARHKELVEYTGDENNVVDEQDLANFHTYLSLLKSSLESELDGQLNENLNTNAGYLLSPRMISPLDKIPDSNTLKYVRIRESEYIVEVIHSKKYLQYIVLKKSSEAIGDGIIRFFQEFHQLSREFGILSIKSKLIERELHN